MAKDNHEKGALELLEELDDLPIDLFDLADWSLPPAFTDELMADTAIQHLKTVQTCEINIIGNKAVHNDAEVARLVQVEGAAKRALQEIKRRYPGALLIVKELAAHQAMVARQQREVAKEY